MRNLLALPVLVFALVACETSKVADAPKEDLTITRGMPVSEVVSMLGNPEYIKKGVDIGGLKMDSWHYEIVISKTTDYREVDTYIEPGDHNFRAFAPKGFVDDAAVQTKLVTTTKTQFMDVLVYDNKVFSVQGEVRVTAEKEDWRSDR